MINKGEKRYLKRKYNLYVEVIVKKIIDENYVLVSSTDVLGFKSLKVRIDKLIKNPPDNYIDFCNEVDEEVKKAEELLLRFK